MDPSSGLDPDAQTVDLERPQETGPPRPPVEASDRYAIEGFLGEGAMGTVWRARDLTLERVVALKFLRAGDPDRLRRFQQEARAQARIEHQHVCPVYEVGELEGHCYIAMRYIPGRPLREAAAGLTLEDKVRVMAEVALAVHAGHRIGIIHRDVKPGNILVEPDPDRGARPWVLDFGIARDTGSASHTAEGSVVGTPAYMAPEQVRGDGVVDRRVDVYGLGATLYSILSGRAPFEGTTRIETLVRVLEEEPPALRRLAPGTPRELETIVATAMNKEPERRYPNARALSEDLQRWLDGEPIQARPPGPLARVSRWTRRNRRLAAVSALALAAVVYLGGSLWHERRTVAARQEIAQELGRDVESIESVLRQARMLPAHDTGAAMKLVRDRMTAFEELAASGGSLDRGPAHYALGLGALALGHLDDARRHLEAAVAEGFTPPAVYAGLGEALGELYVRRREEVSRVGSDELRHARLDQLNARLRQPALEALARGRRPARDDVLYRDAFTAFLSNRREEALEMARTSATRYPWRYEAWLLMARVHLERGRELEDAGDSEGAMAAYEAAGEPLRRARQIGRSDGRLHREEALRLSRMLAVLDADGHWSDELYHQGLAAAEVARVVAPDAAASLNAIARLHRQLGARQLDIGEDPTAALDRAEELSDRAMVLDADDPEGPINLALVARRRATYARRTGGDPRPALETSVRACRRALEIEPDSVVAYANLGTAYYLRAEYQIEVGDDPTESLEAAVAAYRGSLERRETFPIWNNAGLVHWQWAEHLLQRGQDATEALADAAAAFDRALELNPDHGPAWSNLGLILLQQVDAALEAGRDPGPTLPRAIEVLETAVAKMPTLAAGHNNLGNAHTATCEDLLRTGRDPRPHVEAARAAYDEALDLNPALAFVRSNRAFVGILEARWLRLTEQDPSSALEEVRKDLDQALNRDPGYAPALHNRALSWLEEARWRAWSGQDPAAALERALAAADETVAANPNLHYHLALRARIQIERARRSLEDGGVPRVALGVARADLRTARELNPTSLEVEMLRAELAGLEARAASLSGRPGRRELAEGLEILDAIATDDRQDPALLVLEARLLTLAAAVAPGLADSDPKSAAAAACDAAVELNPLYRLPCEDALRPVELTAAQGRSASAD